MIHALNGLASDPEAQPSCGTQQLTRLLQASNMLFHLRYFFRWPLQQDCDNTNINFVGQPHLSVW